jgi:hypothetical protein
MARIVETRVILSKDKQIECLLDAERIEFAHPGDDGVVVYIGGNKFELVISWDKFTRLLITR